MSKDVALTRDEPRTWLDFWTGDHAIYADDRHRDAHYRRLAEDIAALVDLKDRTVLDFGCGEALAAPQLAEQCGALLLYDPAPKAERWRGHDRIQVLTPADWEAMAPSSVDVVLVISVSQYLSSDDLDGLMERLQVLLRPGGSVLFADVVPPHVPVWRDVVTLLDAGWSHGFLGKALLSLVKTWFSPYRRLREEAGFSTYAAGDFLARLSAHGFQARRTPRNVGFSQARMAFLAIKPATP